MRPVELARSTAGLAEHAENLAVERHLVKASGFLVDRKQILSGAVRRDAQRPRSRCIRRIRIEIRQRRMVLLVIPGVQPDYALEVAFGIEDLDASVAAIGN